MIHYCPPMTDRHTAGAAKGGYGPADGRRQRSTSRSSKSYLGNRSKPPSPATPYTSVSPRLAKEAAEKAAKMVPRKQADGQSGSRVSRYVIDRRGLRCRAGFGSILCIT